MEANHLIQQWETNECHVSSVVAHCSVLWKTSEDVDLMIFLEGSSE